MERQKRGFTLIELMIVVAVVTVLAALAITSYNKQIRKGRRAEAKHIILDYATRQEAYRSTHTIYATTETLLLNGGTPSQKLYYSVALSTPSVNCNDAGPTAATSANSFAITATAVGDQAQDSACTPLVVTSLCGQVIRSPDPTAPSACW